MTERYAGTLLVARKALRRDRLLVGIWVALLVLVVYASAAATGSLYETTADRVAAARAINDNPAVVALYGPILDVHSLGELAMTKVTVLYTVILALMFLVVVRRHTRGEEESGHAELLAGTAIGRDALLAAALVEGLVLSAVAGSLAALADIAGGLPVPGSIAFGATWVGIGLVSTGLTALCCQLAASSRTCFGIAGAAIAVLYLMRAVGDVGAEWLSWLTPFGWNTRLRAWSEPRWWLLLLYVALAVALAVAAQLLRARRDLGSGLFPARPGPAHGSPRLSDVLALTWRLNRPALLGWSVGVLALGTVMGAIAPGVGDLLDTDQGRRLIESLGGTGALEDALLAAVLSISAVVITCFGIAVVTRGSADEHDGRTEQVLATATSRSRTILAAFAVALGGAAWLLTLAGLSTGIGLGRDIGGLLAAGLAQLPAVWLVLGLAALLYAVRSRWAVAAWGLLGLFFVLGEIGALLELPEWVIGLSPYQHIPAMPAESFQVGPAVTLTVIAAGLLLAAWVAFRRRDIA
jgi:polyether ionophore transport system permease protein